MSKTWAEMTDQERWDHSQRHGTDYHRNNPNPSADIISFVNDQVSNITVTQPSEFLQAMAGDDVVNNRLYTSDPALLPQSNYAETQTAAQNIQNSGFQGQDGDSFYNTGNPDLNEALYGSDVSQNLSYDGQGWEIPRHLEQNVGFDLAMALGQNLLLGGLSGGGLFNAIGGLSQAQTAADIAGTAGNIIYNLNDINDEVRQGEPSRLPDTQGLLTGGVNFIEFENPDGTSTRIPIQDQPAPAPQPVEEEGGGGQSTQSDAAPRSTGGQQPPEAGEDQWIYNGQGELVEVGGEGRIDIPNPAGLVIGEVYTSDAEPYYGNSDQPTEDPGQSVFDTVFGSPFSGSVTVTQNTNGVEGAPAYYGTGIYGEPVADWAQGGPAINGMALDDTQNTGGIGTGGGSGDGAGDGQDSGEGGGSGQGMLLGPTTGGAGSNSNWEDFMSGISYETPMLSRANIQLQDFLAELLRRG